MKHLSRLLALAAFTAFSGAAFAQTPVALTFMTSYGPNQSRGVVLQELIDQFNKDHAGKIAIKLQINPDHPAMEAKLRTMIAAGDPPDIFHYNFNPNDRAIPESGKLLDFSPYMDADWRARFNEGDLKLFTVDGKLISLPWQQSPAMFYYNADLFRKAGIESFPKTWNELLDDCGALQKAGVACLSLFTKNDAWHTSNVLTYVAACHGGLDVFAANRIDSDAVTKAFEVVKQLFGFGTKDAVGANYDVSSKNFLLGRTAMVIDGPWAIGPMNKQFTSGEIKVAAAPTCDDAQAPAGFIVTDAPSPMAAGGTDDKARADAIVEWFKFFTSEASAEKFAVEGSQPVAFRQNIDKSKVNPLFASYLAASSEAPGKVISAQRVLHPAAQTAFPSILEALALDQLSPKDAAAQLAAANAQ